MNLVFDIKALIDPWEYFTSTLIVVEMMRLRSTSRKFPLDIRKYGKREDEHVSHNTTRILDSNANCSKFIMHSWVTHTKSTAVFKLKVVISFTKVIKFKVIAFSPRSLVA